MAFILSQTEVDVLLPAGPTSVPGTSERPMVREAVNWTAPTLGRLERLFELLADRLQFHLAQRLSGTVTVEYLGLAPGASVPANVAPGLGSWVLQGARRNDTARIALETSLIFSLVDGLLGGTSSKVSDAARQLTALERTLLTRTVELISAALIEAGQSGDGTEVNGLSVHAETEGGGGRQVNPAAVLVGFDVIVEETGGLVHLELSPGLIDQLVVTPCRNEEDHDGEATEGVRVTVQLSDTCLPAEQVSTLTVGDVIVTEQPVAGGLEVLVEDRPVFRASPGAWEGQRAVILDGIKDDQRSRDS